MTVANRSVNWLTAGLSITSIFAIMTSVLIAGKWGYVGGVWGVATFLVPYLVALVAYGYIATKIKTNYKDFVTYSDVITANVGPFTGGILRTQYTLGTVYSVLVNLLCVKIILEVWQISLSASIIYMALVILGVLAYCWRGGLASSLRTDMVQATLIITIAISIFTFVMFGQPTEAITAAFTKPFNPELLINPLLLWIFILGSSAFGDMEMMNRTAAMKDSSQVKKAFISAAVFTVVSVGLLGMVGMFGTPGLVKPDQAIVSVIKASDWIVQLLFLVACMGWLTSNLDSSIVAGGTIISHDWWKKKDITAFRVGMVAVAGLGLLLASFNINPIEAYIVWSIYRMVTLPSTVAVANKIQFDDRVFAVAFAVALIVAGSIAFAVSYYKLHILVTILAYLVGLAISVAGIYIGHKKLAHDTK